MKQKIIIEYDDQHETPYSALQLVSNVICQGKVSYRNVGGESIPHYCWATTFKGATVETIPKRRANAADSFRVVPR